VTFQVSTSRLFQISPWPCPFVAGGVRSEGASYAVGFMNITTDTTEVGFIQVMIVAVNETIARVQARRPSTSVICTLS